MSSVIQGSMVGHAPAWKGAEKIIFVSADIGPQKMAEATHFGLSLPPAD